MKLWFIGCASVVALAAFAMTGNGAVAAEQTNPKPGQGCDLRNTPGCKPGKTINPASGTPHTKGPENPAHHGGGDKPHSTPTGGGTDPPPPPRPQ